MQSLVSKGNANTAAGVPVGAGIMIMAIFVLNVQHAIMFNLILFGPPGSGKGTQSQKIIEQYGLIHLSTGDILRREIAARTPLGQEAARLMARGQLVPDEVVIGMIESMIQLNPNAKGFLFDGFPRTLAQAEALDKLLALKKTSIHKVLALDVSEEELVTRLLKRGQTSDRPDDRDESIIRKRYQVYKNETEIVGQHYKKHDKLEVLNGEGSVDEIFAALRNSIERELAAQEAASLNEQ
jgi:adenylate kinase